MKTLRVSAFADEIDKDFTVQLRELNAHGVHFIELRGINGNPAVSYSLEEIKAFGRQMKEAGITVSSIGSPIGKTDVNGSLDELLSDLQHVLDIANVLGSKYIRMFSFWMPKGEDPAKYRDTVLTKMKAMVALAEKNGVILLHENEKEIYGDTPERCLDILESVNSPWLRAVYDPANFVQCGCDPVAAFHMVKPYVVYMHIKDAVKTSNVNVPAGEGDGHIPEIIASLVADGYNGFISLEPHLAVFDGLAKLEGNSKVSQEHVGEGIKMFGVAVDALDKVLTSINVQRA